MHKIIGSKDVYIIEDHHQALLPWAMIREKLEKPPLLISLDHHTDTRSAFQGHSYFELGKSTNRMNSSEGDDLRRKLAASIDFNDLGTVEKAISKLRHDEHIHAAILSGIIDFAFIIQLMDSSGTASVEHKKYMTEKFAAPAPWNKAINKPNPPFTYEIPEDRMFVVPTMCLPNCRKVPHDDDCTRLLYDNVLEDAFLGPKLKTAREMASFCDISNLLATPYILDIDLDFFHTRRAVEPENPKTFLELVRNARAITIALEPGCVANLQLDGENISAEYLLNQVCELLQSA